MKKRLIIIGSILAVIIAGFVLVFVNLEGIVNRNKDFLLTRAETAIGRKVTLDEIGITLRGGIGVRLDNFSVSDDPEFSSEPFIEASSLQVNAKLLPLLKKQFEIKRVVLHDPRIRIIRNKNGLLNTSTFGAAADAQPASSPEQGAPTASDAAPLVISLINIENGELTFVDESQGLDLRLTQIESKVEELDLEQPITLGIRAAFLSETRNIDMKGTFGPVGQGMNTDDLSIDGSLAIDPIDIRMLTGAVPALAEAMPPGINIAGPLSVKIDANGTPATLNVVLDMDASNSAVTVPNSLNKPSGIPLTIRSSAKVSPEVVLIESLDLTFHTASLTGKGTYRLTTPPSIDLSVDSKPTPLAGWADLVPAMSPYDLTGEATLSLHVSGALTPGAVPKVEGTATITDAGATVPQLIKPVSNVKTKIAFTDKQATVSNASAVIGQTRIEGSASIESFEPLVVNYDATSPSIALDDLRPPNPKAKKPEVLEGVDVKGRMVVAEEPSNRGTFTSTKGSIGNLDYGNLKGTFSVVGKETELTDVEVQALDGVIKGSGLITMNDDVPTFDFRSEASDLNVIALFDMLPDATRQFLSGKASMNINVSGTGKEWQDIQSTISGDGLAELFNGAVIDFNLFDAVSSQLASVTGKQNVISQGLKDKYPKVFKERNTEFKNLKSDFVIQDGKLLARNLNLNADEFVIGAKGALGFDKSLNLSVNLLLSRALTADLIKDFKEAQYLANDNGQIEVPFMLEGALPKPRVKLDQNYINKAIEKALVQKGFELFKDQDLGKEVKDLFNFGKKKKAPADTTSQK